jgi:hypothetical protein
LPNKTLVGLLALWLAVWETIVHLQGQVAVSAAQLELVRPFYNAHVVMRLKLCAPCLCCCPDAGSAPLGPGAQAMRRRKAVVQYLREQEEHSAAATASGLSPEVLAYHRAGLGLARAALHHCNLLRSTHRQPRWQQQQQQQQPQAPQQEQQQQHPPCS